MADLYDRLHTVNVTSTDTLLSVLRVITSIADHSRDTRRTNIKTVVVASDNAIHTLITPDIPQIVASVLSPSGKYLAVLREATEDRTSHEKRRYVEIWSEANLVAEQDVTDVHGAFYTDG